VTGQPGLANQRGVRLFFQVVGPVLIVVGLALFIAGVRAVFGHMDDFDGPSGGDIARFMGGFLLFGIGLQLTRVGFLGASARYVSGEVSPVIRDAYTHVTERPAERKGPFCTRCGVRQDEEARFCDACGSPVG
jgi:hypothetical protein